MLADTWDNIFWALRWAGAGLVVTYYFYPKFFESADQTNKNGPLYMSIIIYMMIWAIVLIIYYFYVGKTNSVTKGLWRLKPEYSKESDKYDFKNQIMIPSTGMVELLSEHDTTKYLTETFTFSFFVSIDHSSIEGVQGASLKNDYKPYQLIVTIPGVFCIFVDPFHETLSIDFHSHNASKYNVTLPTLKNNKWHQILISIEGRTADIYQNGILLKSVGLKNVIAARPGKPKVNMNPDMYAKLAFVQAWPKRIKEIDVVNNYRWNTDAQGVPPIPSITVDSPFLSFLRGLRLYGYCLGTFCEDSV